MLDLDLARLEIKSLCFSLINTAGDEAKMTHHKKMFYVSCRLDDLRVYLRGFRPRP